jgi:hypothetical protein
MQTLVVSSPWAFGWTHLLTLVGFGITLWIANRGFRTFDDWKREKVEEKRIDLALEALAIAYEAKHVIDHINQWEMYDAEWKDMPAIEGEDEDARRLRAPDYVLHKRMKQHDDFFQRVYKIQPRLMAAFGKESEKTFEALQHAVNVMRWYWGLEALKRNLDRVEESGTAEEKEKIPELRKFVEELEQSENDEEKSKIEFFLKVFCSEIEELCQPVIERRPAKDDDQ